MSETDTEISITVENVVRSCVLQIESQQMMSKEEATILSVITNSPEDGSMLLSPTHSYVTNPDVTVEPMDVEINDAKKVSSDKTRNKHYNLWLDRYIEANGGNLYPTREEKNRIAKEMEVSAERVNRFFANRRRKQKKMKPKKEDEQEKEMLLLDQHHHHSSPVTFMATSGGLPSIVNEASAVSPHIVEFSQAAPAAQNIGGEGEDEQFLTEQQLLESAMVALHNIQQQFEMTPLQATLLQLIQQQQQQQQNEGESSSAQNQVEQNAKMLAFQQPNVQLLMLILQQQLQSGSSINLNAAVQQVQAHILHQQISQMQAQLAAAQMQQQQQQQEQQEQQMKEIQQQWGGSSISASPMINSDSEISEQSELSPNIYMQMLEQQQKSASSPDGLDRIRSPPFKDPHQIADPEMTKLLDPCTSSEFQFGHTPSSLAYSRLTEREKLAVTALTDLGVKAYIR